jgi:hypothetical protein
MIVSEASHAALQKAAKGYRVAIDLQSVAAELTTEFPDAAALLDRAIKLPTATAKKAEQG